MRRILILAVAFAAVSSIGNADHLRPDECHAYFECVLGLESALNHCYDNDHLKKIGQNRVMCMRIAQHSCKVKAGIFGKGKRMTKIRPIDEFGRPTLLEVEPGIEQDTEIYNYAGWNHCPPQYQGMQDFWCDPHQTRYPARPWCDVVPEYKASGKH